MSKPRAGNVVDVPSRAGPVRSPARFSGSARKAKAARRDPWPVSTVSGRPKRATAPAEATGGHRRAVR